ncbi:MAG: alpha/beta fold hydrolase [Gammaproteobacteria bacterium]|nr:MAG: alpha/beta fold hydrolase [Gammaproteobacteria bacterium]
MNHKVLLLLIALVLSPPSPAAVTVLIHGFLGSNRSWLESGVIEQLAQHGYEWRGSYSPGPGKAVFVPIGSSPGPKPVYTVNLPSTAPIRLQADWLAAYLQDIRRRQPGEPIVLVGHSAGGVVARAALVLNGVEGVTRLITIAAPHLGTWRSIQALEALDDDDLFFIPIGRIKRWLIKRRLGGWLYYTLKASRGVLYDLRPAVPGSFLYWLNRLPHPDIDYVSLIRSGTFYMPGDRIVPPFSQDMRLVPAIGKRARSYTTPAGHLLNPHDGAVLAWQLDHPKGESPSETAADEPTVQ